MRILLLAQSFSYNNANSLRYWALVKRLSAIGYSIDIIGDKQLQDKEIPENVRYFVARKEITFLTFFPILFDVILEFFKQYFLWSLAFKNKHVAFLLILNGIVRYRINKLIADKQYDIVLMGVVPWNYYTFARKLANVSSLIVDISDPLYKNAALDLKFQGNRIYRYYEKKSLEYAKKVIVMSEPLVDLYKNELGLSADKLIFISPTTHIDSYQQGEIITYLIEHKPVKFLYAGAIYPGYRDMEQLLPVVRSIQDINLKIVSSTKFIQEENIYYSPWLSQQKLYEEYTKADILVFIDNFFGYQIPSKIFELLALNKPILFIYDNRNTYLYHKLYKQEGIFFAQNTQKDIAEAIRMIINKQQITVYYTFDMRAYSNENMVQQLVEVMEDKEINKI